MTQQERSALVDMQNASPEALQSYYDDWASEYDADLADMGYQAPEMAARMLAEQNLPPTARILDVGCGTGLTGQALESRGFTALTGLDLSKASLKLAKNKKCYEALHPCDINQPLPFADGIFAAAQCIGTLTYVADVESFMRELCRVVRPASPILFTHRQDLYTSDFNAALARVTEDGLWTLVHRSDPQPYLPNYAAFDREQDIRYNLYRTAD